MDKREAQQGADGGSFDRLSDIFRDPRGYGQVLQARLGRQFEENPAVTSAITVVAALLLIGFTYVAYVGSTAPTADELDQEAFARASIVYTSDGEEITRFYQENRTWVPLDSMAPVLKQATLATEDRRFYDHFGVDIYRTLGALWSTAQGDDQGGSTLTMQLARNAFPELQDDFVLTRKIREWSTARHIERHYEKDEILEMYLNMMPFLYDAYGVEAASETYFQRSASDLNTKQASTLIAMLRGPSLYNPRENPDINRERRNQVMANLVAVGALEQDRYEELAQEETELDFQRIDHTHQLAPHFAEHVRRQVSDWAEDRGYNIYTDGLRIHTTLDGRLQREADEVAQQHISDLQTVVDVTWATRNQPVTSRDPADYQPFHDEDTAFNYYWQENPDAMNAFLRQTEQYERALEDGYDQQEALRRIQENETLVDSVRARVERLETGLVAMEPGTGYVRAWVGGRDFEIDRFDRVSQSQRQPGSTFKPFVFGAALENHGLRPTDMMQDSEVSYEFEVTGDTWEPSNFGEVTNDTLSLRDALAQSINTITAQLTIDMGPERVAQQARDMGIRSDLVEYPSIGLGTSGVTLLEMAVAYSTIANNGTRPDPVAVTRIEDRNGELIETFESRHEEVMSDHAAHDLLDMLRAVIEDGTGVGLNQYVSGDLGGKTGTTQDNADTWFMMVHPELVIGGWVGFNNPALTFRDREWGVGSRSALPLVGRFAERAELSSEASFQEPPGWTEPTAPSDTLTLAEVERSLDDAFEDADADIDDRDPLADDGETGADEGPDLTDVEEQEPADSLNREQQIDVSIGGDNDSDADTSGSRGGW